LTALEGRVYSDRKIALAAVSQRTADLLGHFLQRRDVRVIPNGVDTRQFSVSARLARRRDARSRRNFCEADFVLLLIGNDWRVKGVPAILAAMAAAPATPLHLLVAGDDRADSFRKMAERLDILDRCQWETPRTDVIDLYAAADVYVSPSREDSFGLPVAEAMACGLPVVTSVFAGVSSSIRNGIEGFILDDPRDSGVLAALLVKIHGDETLRRRVGEAAARAAENWTWDRNAEAVWQLLKDATAKKREAH
jgi:UDP-glucose:(heptosyl)LPS alpha-1,3-glucosyltransferase